MSKLVEDLTQFEDRRGRTLHFSKFHSPAGLVCWEELPSQGGWNQARCFGLHVKWVDEDNLKFIGVWDKLSKKVQSQVADFGHEQAAIEEANRQAVREKMGKARKARRQKYPDIPKEITCTNCGTVIKQAPSVTAATCRRKNILVTDYIKGFECRSCNPPKRGRQIDPKYAHLPKEIELVCSKKGCSEKRTVTRSNVIAAAKKKELEVDKYMKTYVCPKCNPTKRKRSKPKTNEENPYKIQCCICKDWKGTNPEQVAHLAKTKGWTAEKVYQKYVCKACDAKLPQSKKFRKRKKKS